MRKWFALLGLLFAVAATAFPAFGENRVALVIGEEAYEHVEPLRKAVADARGYAAALREKGYSVAEGYNVTTLELNLKVAAFVEAIQPGDTAVFVYSGHGWSDGSQNFIIGVDAPSTASQESLARISVPIKNDRTGILDDMERKGAGLKVAIIDACRDNPFAPPPGSKGFAFKRGLTVMSPPSGTFVVFSAEAGQGALDRLSEADADPNSVFTRIFLPQLRADLTLQDAIKASQAKVARLSRGVGAEWEQKPAYYDGVIGPACLSATCKGAAPEPDLAATAQQAAFDAAMAADTVEALDAYLAKYPVGPLARIARNERDRLVRLAALTPAPVPTPTTAGPCGGVGSLASLISRGAGVLLRDESCALKRGDVFKECADCPAMVVIPEGSFTMGSPDSEPARSSDEGPQHVVKFAKAFAVGEFDVTKDEFAAFVRETGYDAGSTCLIRNNEKWRETADHSWRDPGFPQTGSHPVACVNWNDATKYVDWLERKTGQPYRLLSESEWEYSARGQTAPGSYPRYFFGNSEKDFCAYGNGADETKQKQVPGASNWTTLPCSSGYPYTSPVGSFKPNPFGPAILILEKRHEGSGGTS